jgi:hypothetical protein
MGPARDGLHNGQTGLRPESCWNDCLARRKSIRPCVPSHVAYGVGQKWLKSGYMDKRVLHESMDGTPQGGIISPALC